MDIREEFAILTRAVRSSLVFTTLQTILKLSDLKATTLTYHFQVSICFPGSFFAVFA